MKLVMEYVLGKEVLRVLLRGGVYTVELPEGKISFCLEDISLKDIETILMEIKYELLPYL
jgi:hypothetical protein